MGIHADTLHLPVLLPVRWPMREQDMGRRPRARGRMPERPWRQRVYRLPPRGRGEGFTYGPDARTAVPTAIGRWIDFYV